MIQFVSLRSSEKKSVASVGRSLMQGVRKLICSKKWQSLKSLNFSKGKYNNLDKEESAVTEKVNEISDSRTNSKCKSPYAGAHCVKLIHIAVWRISSHPLTFLYFQ